MHYIKCLDISQIPEPTLADVPRFIWVATGEFYVDLEISKVPTRIRISDIVTKYALPDHPRESALYKHNGKYKYHTEDGWQIIATTADIDAVSAQLAELNTSVNGIVSSLDNESTGIIALNQRVTAVEERADSLESTDESLTTRVGVIEQSLDGLVIRLEEI